MLIWQDALCRDLLSLAGSQQQHAPRAPLPAFGGHTGLAVAKSITGIQARLSLFSLVTPAGLSQSCLLTNTTKPGF